MQAESLDVLERAEMPASQARAIIRAIEIEIGSATANLARRADIELLEAKIENRFGALDSKLESRFGTIEVKQEGLRGELRAEIRDLRAEMHATASKSSWLLYGALVTQITTLLGVGYFFVAHVSR